MAQEFSVQAVISAVDKNFSTVMDKAGSSLKGLSSSATNTQGTVSNASNGMFSSMKNMAGAFGLVAVAGKAFDVVKDSVGAAVARFDTLNNYPVVMKSLGYSMTDVAKSSKILQAGIDGLPTSLDAITGITQQFAPLTGSAEKAAQSAIALNNAFLAGGKGTEAAARGLEQYTQMLSVGKVDLEAWRTLMETMPGPLRQVAKAFGFAGKSATMDLFKALQDGTITMDELNNKFIELNSGTNGFAQQAKNATAGIGTSFENMKTAVTRGITEIINALDEFVIELTGSSIATHVTNFGKAIANGFKIAANVLKAITPAIKTFANILKTVFNNEIVQSFIAGLAGLAGVWAIVQGGVKAFSMLKNAIDIAGAAFLVLKDVLTGLSMTSIIGIILAVVAALVYFFTQTETGRKMWSSFIEWLKNAWNTVLEKAEQIREGVVNAWKAMVDGVKNVWNGITEFFSNLWNNIVLIATTVWNTLVTTVTTVVEQIKAVWNGIGEFFSMLWQGIVMVATTVWNTLVSVVTTVVTSIQSAWSGFSSFMSTLWTMIITAVQAAWNNLVSVIQTVWSVIQSVVQTAMSIIQGIITAIMAAIRGDWTGAWNALKGVAQTVGNAIKAVVTNFMNGVKNVFTNTWNKAKEIFDTGIKKCLNAVKNVGSQMISAGRDFVMGFVKGITGAIGDAVNAAARMAKSALNAAKSALKSHSPSRVMMDLGGDTAEGFAIGITKGISDVIASATRMANAAIISPRLNTQQLQASLAGLNTNLAAQYSGSLTMQGNTVSTARLENLLYELVNKSGDVYMDSNKVGRVVSPTVDSNIGHDVLLKDRWS